MSQKPHARKGDLAPVGGAVTGRTRQKTNPDRRRGDVIVLDTLSALSPKAIKRVLPAARAAANAARIETDGYPAKLSDGLPNEGLGRMEQNIARKMTRKK